MANQKNYGFRGAFGGYNKAEVHNYISKMAKDMERLTDEWETERAQYLKEIQNRKEESDKSAQLYDKIIGKYRNVLSKLNEMEVLLTEERQKTETLLAEKESFAERLARLADYDLTKESLAKAKVSLLKEQKRAQTLQKERDELSTRMTTLERESDIW